MTKLATDLPKPPPLTEEDLQRLAEEGGKFVKAVEKETAGLEQLTGEDLAIVIGGPGCSCRRHR